MYGVEVYATKDVKLLRDNISVVSRVASNLGMRWNNQDVFVVDGSIEHCAVKKVA